MNRLNGIIDNVVAGVLLTAILFTANEVKKWLGRHRTTSLTMEPMPIRTLVAITLSLVLSWLTWLRMVPPGNLAGLVAVAEWLVFAVIVIGVAGSLGFMVMAARRAGHRYLYLATLFWLTLAWLAFVIWFGLALKPGILRGQS